MNAKFTQIYTNLFFIFFITFIVMGIPPSIALRICGNYCGPDWCNGLELPEASCDTSVSPQEAVYDVDACCREHDRCCGHQNRTPCNSQLVECLYEFSKNPENYQPSGNVLELEISKKFPGNSKNNLEFFQICESWAIRDFFIALRLISSIDTSLFNKSICCGGHC